MTFFHKRLFPLAWFGGVAIFAAIGIVEIARNQAPLFVVFVPIGMLLFGFFLMKRLVFDLLDEVYLDNDHIVIRNGGAEDRFRVQNILNVDCSVMTSPERITLTLHEPCGFGSEITFSPPTRLWPFGRHPLAKELIQLAHGDRALRT
jgi:hypothetical protein